MIQKLGLHVKLDLLLLVWTVPTTGTHHNILEAQGHACRTGSKEVSIMSIRTNQPVMILSWQQLQHAHAYMYKARDTRFKLLEEA